MLKTRRKKQMWQEKSIVLNCVSHCSSSDLTFNWKTKQNKTQHLNIIVCAFLYAHTSAFL